MPDVAALVGLLGVSTFEQRGRNLVAPYCALLRDYLGDTPHILRYVVCVCLNIIILIIQEVGCNTPHPSMHLLEVRYPLARLVEGVS